MCEDIVAWKTRIGSHRKRQIIKENKLALYLNYTKTHYMLTLSKESIAYIGVAPRIGERGLKS